MSPEPIWVPSSGSKNVTIFKQPRSIVKLLGLLLAAQLLILAPEINCQLANNNQSDSGNSSSPTIFSEQPLSIDGNEYVDHTEAPIPLFDSLSSSSEDDEADARAENQASSTATPETTTQISLNTTKPIDETTTNPVNGEKLLNVAMDNLSEPKNRNLDQTIDQTTTLKPNNISEISGDEEEATDGSSAESAPGDDETETEAEAEGEGQGEDDKQAHFEVPQNVSQYMDYIEHLMHDLRHRISDLFEPHIPRLIRTSQMVEVSGSCSHDILRMALALRQFEPWALKMIDSSGKVPEGILEGSFTALGSYDQCLNIVFGPSSSQHQTSTTTTTSQTTPNINHQQTHGKYCLVNLSPYLPPKPKPAAMVEQLFQEEANRRNYTKDDQLTRLSPMFYYMQFRIGVCVPSTCNDSDMDSISSTLSSSLRLNITVNACRVKQNQPVTTHQLVGGSIVAILVSIVIAATLMDYWKYSWDKLVKQETEIVLLSVNDIKQPKQQLQLVRNSPDCNEKCVSLSLVSNAMVDKSDSLSSSQANNKQNISNNLRSVTDSGRSSDSHSRWIWKSFSVLANFTIYFRQPQTLKLTNEANGCCRTCLTQHPACGPQNPIGPQKSSQQSIISCLNGIRVISLCWVIVANSYITLDPRATKRLTKTREAPRDFLFQMIAQASLAIETFFFLSGILMSVSFSRRLRPYLVESCDISMRFSSSFGHVLRWLRFYLHRYIRLTPATMLVIAFTMFSFRFGDGPLWMEVTQKAHMSCRQNWWRHLLHVANFIDTRQMCFIHYWYIAADMQLFLFAPILMLLVYRNRLYGYLAAASIGCVSVGWVFYTTYIRNLPPTLLFYSSDPETRREFGNTIMTKPLTHVLPYMVGMLLGKWLTTINDEPTQSSPTTKSSLSKRVLKLWGFSAMVIAMFEIFVPYLWNNSQPPSPLLSSLYAASFRLGWTISLAYLVISCGHKRGKRCVSYQFRCIDEPSISQTQIRTQTQTHGRSTTISTTNLNSEIMPNATRQSRSSFELQQQQMHSVQHRLDPCYETQDQLASYEREQSAKSSWCFCGSGGSLMNRFLSLNIFTHLSKLSFVAYLIHLPLMSLFIAQTRGLFAFSHLLVMHLALSYLLMTFIVSFVLVHVIEFPFITLERYYFEKFFPNERKFSPKPQAHS